mmetsp:Transcript_23913/g.52308  ORF Transcript_23913/g.52308 Transcript_23913/m.52308 type:complete len:228 (+) Transcript_23913:54-737(+)
MTIWFRKKLKAQAANLANKILQRLRCNSRNCLGVLDSHGVGGSNNSVTSLDNDNSVSGLADSIGNEFSNARVDGLIRFFNGRNHNSLASLHVSKCLTGDLLASGKNGDGSSGSELGNLLSGGTGFGTDDNGLGFNINGGLYGRGSNGLGSGELSELVEGRVADCGVKSVVVDGDFGFDTGFGHDGDGGFWVVSVGGFTGKHDGIGSVEDGVGDIGTFSTGRARVGDH